MTYRNATHLKDNGDKLQNYIRNTDKQSLAIGYNYNSNKLSLSTNSFESVKSLMYLKVNMINVPQSEYDQCTSK